MDPNLVIDDSYVMSARNACVRHGNDLEQILDSYCAILSEIHEEALVDGETSDALELFIACVAKLNDQLSTLSKTILLAYFIFG